MENKISKKISDLMENDDIFFDAEIRIGPFKLLNQIGKGKFATVSLGIHEETKEKVAIKQIKKSELNTDNLLTKEINIQKILFHPYLTKMYCVIENEEKIFIITEYCSKGDIITNLIENGEFDESKSCKIFQQILSSLEYLHNNNICHRDIKPENILLDEYGDAKLSDFGLSKKFEKNELLKTACGSPIYAAPEMIQGKPYKGTCTDIWSLGISLYTMICGELPFDIEDGEDMKTLVYNITHGKYTIPEYVSPLCKDLIQKILEINPEKRITIDEIKNHKWVNSFDFNYLKSPGVILDEYFLPVDIYLIKDIEGENEEKIRKMVKDILMNKHNINTINYYLQNEIKKRKGEKSISDLRATSGLFLEYINDEKSKKKYWENDINKIEDYYTKQILDLFNIEKMKNIEIKKKKKETLKKENINEDRKHQMNRFKTDLKLNIKNEDNQNKEPKINNEKGNNDKNINNIFPKEDKEENNVNKIENLKYNKKNDLEILNLYIGPLIFIHDLIDNIITKVINIETEKKKNSNFFVSSSIKVEIKQDKKYIPNDNDNNISLNIIKNLKEKTERKLSYQEQFSINKTQIELVSTPKQIKNSFSFINKEQSQNIENNTIKKTERGKRSASCHIKKSKKNQQNKNIISKNNTPRNNKKDNIKKRINLKKNKNENKLKIIKSIDLSSKGTLNKKRNSLKKRNKSNSKIKHLQINIIKNEIIIADSNFYNKEIGLVKNYSQNYSFDFNKNLQYKSKLFKNKLINNSKNINRIPLSKFFNKSVDSKTQNLTKNENPNNLKKNKNYLNIKREILIPSHKDNHNLNKFLNTPNSREKKSLPSSSSHKLGSFYSPNPHKGIVKNIFINKKYSYIKNSEENNIDNKNIIALKAKRNKKIILINNIKKDFNDFNPNSNKYFNNYIKNKKYQEMNNQHNSQLISLFSQPNENESDKNNKKVNKTNDININISSYKYGKSPSKENIKHNINNNSKNRKKDETHNNNNNNEGKSVKTGISKNISLNKKRNKNNKNNDIEKGDGKLIRTKISFDSIRHIIKRYVGNNVLESKDNGNFKFICKTKCGKDDLIFHLELISKSFDVLTFEGTLVKGETKLYKELFFKIKEKLI